MKKTRNHLHAADDSHHVAATVSDGAVPLDPATPPGEEEEAQSQQAEGPWLRGRQLRMLLCCAGAPFLIMLDTNIVAVSLPSIARELHGQFTDVEWVVSAYILPFAALLIPAGAISDLLGRRRMLVIGLSIFTIASALCGLAPSLAVLNGARALQAIGAALQLSASLAVITNGFASHQRARVFTIWATVMGVAPSLGPTLGGLITTYLGWRWAFFINLPLGVVLIMAAIASVDESKDPQAGRLDLLGMILFGSGLFSVIWALIDANDVGWGSAATLSKLAIGAALLVAFAIAERIHPRPMVDLSLFRNRIAVGAAVAMLAYASTGQVMMTLLPLYMQDAFNFSPARAGLAMVAFALPLLVGPTVNGLMAARLPSRTILCSGLILIAFGNALMATLILMRGSYWTTAAGMVVVGFGVGLLNGETAKAQISAVPPDRAGMGSGISGATRFLGIILGLTGLGGVLSAVAESKLIQATVGEVSGHVIDWHALSSRVAGGDLNGGLSALPEAMRAEIAPAVAASIATGFGFAIAVAAVVAAFSGVLVWRLFRPNSVL